MKKDIPKAIEYLEKSYSIDAFPSAAEALGIDYYYCEMCTYVFIFILFSQDSWNKVMCKRILLILCLEG